MTSAVYSPRLKKNIALAMIDVNYVELDNKLKVLDGTKEISCSVVEKPFFDPKKKIASS